MASKIFYLLLSLVAFAGFSQSTDVIMNAGSNNTSVSTCLGGLYDSGGSGAGGPYSPNESFVITVCPDVPGDFMTLQWTVFNLDPTNTNPNPGQTNADNITIYDGDNTGAPTLGTYYSGDLTPGDLFGATPTNPTGCLTIEFNSNGGLVTGDFSAQLSCKTPCDPPFADGMIVNADNATGDSIAVCVDEVITFQDNGSTAGPSGLFVLEKWVWNWNDGTPNDTLLSGAQVTHSFENPGQYIIQLVVIDDNDCVNTNATDIQVFVSTYPTFIPFPTDTTLCIGESIELAANPAAYDSTWSGFPSQTISDAPCMQDLTGIVQPTPLPLTGFDPTTSLTNANPDILSICVDIEHSFVGDFVLQVQCPTGQIMTLYQQGGGGTQLGVPVQADNVDCADASTLGTPWTYCFDATSTQTWVQAINAGNTVPNASGGNSLVAGNYAPVDPLGFAALDGCPINGTWNMLFTDLWGADDGSISGWSINFDPILYPPVTNFTPSIGNGNTGNPATDSSYWELSDPFITSNSSDFDTIVVTPTQPGTFLYTYSAINNFGCAFDSTVTITVDPLQEINAGPDVTLCIGQSIIIGPDNTTGAGCDYNVLFVDSWGDGWNGNEVEITTIAGGTVTYQGPPADSIWVTLPVTNGEVITIDFNNLAAGANDCEILIYDATGALVYSDGIGFGAPSNNPQFLTVNCYTGYTFDWTPTANILSSPNSVNPQVNPPVQTTYTLTTYPAGRPLCATADSLVVFMGPLIDPGNDTLVNICNYDAPVDLFNFIAGTPQTNGYWLSAAGSTISMPIDPSTFVSGVYEYRIDSVDCTASSFLTVNVIELPITLLTTDATCTTVSDGIIDLSSPMANGFSIDGGATFQPAGLFTGLLHGSYNVVVTSAPNGNCTATAVAVINEPDSLSLTSLSPPKKVCQGSTVALEASASGGNGNYTFTWDNGIGFGDRVNYSPAISDSVCVVLSEDCPSPTVSKCTYVEVPAPVDIDFSFAGEPIPKETKGCYDHSFQINNLSSSTAIVVGGVVTSPATDVNRMQTTWRLIDAASGSVSSVLGSSKLDSVMHTLKTPGVYNLEVIVRTQENCEHAITYPGVIEVFDHPVADFTFSPDQVTIYNTQAAFNDLSEGDPVEWFWEFQGAPSPTKSTQKNPVVVYQEGKPGNFQVDLSVRDMNGCEDNATKYIDVINDVNVFAPNIFTPDGDAINPNWRVYISGIEQYDYHLSVFNRWGELVFESYDPEGTWDGTYGNSGEIVLPGNYVWIIDTKDLQKDNRYTFTGSLLIAR